MTTRSHNRSRHLGICLLLAAVTLGVYWPVTGYEFVNFDDPDYLINNTILHPGLTAQGARWAFSADHMGIWHPLTWLSHMLDFQLFGDQPGRHHLTSLLIHVVNAWLLFAVVNAMTNKLWESAAVAALFALHPLHVESVAWVSERKDVLSSSFWLLTMGAYLCYVKRRSKAWYAAALLFLGLGSLAKPMLVTLPFVLLLIDYWPLERFEFERSDRARFTRLVLEKTPFLVVAAALSLVTFLVQQEWGSVKSTTVVPLGIRINNALLSYATYIEKMFWPSDLAFFYPHPGLAISVWQVALSLAVLLGISGLAIWQHRERKYLAVGWFWYVGTLVPVIGLVQVGDQAMADRYTYLTLTGLFIVIIWGIAELSSGWRHRGVILGAGAATAIAGLSVATFFQQQHWRNSIALFTHALEVTENNHIAHFCIAQPLRERGEVDLAISHLRECLEIIPDYMRAHNGLGVAYLKKGQFDRAVPHLETALRSSPDAPEVHTNLGLAWEMKGDLERSVSFYERALELGESAEAYTNVGRVLAQQGELAQALPYFEKSLMVAPGYFDGRKNLAVALHQMGRSEEAIAEYRRALRIDPGNAEMHNYLGAALAQVGRIDEAIAEFEVAIALQPQYEAARANLGSALAVREPQRPQPPEAVPAPDPAAR